MILAGRRINEAMGSHVAAKTVRLLIERGQAVKGARVAVLGVTFKPEVPDLRNSRVPDIVRELEGFGVEVLVHDPLVDAKEVEREYRITLRGREDLTSLDAVILAVRHEVLIPLTRELMGQVPVLVDVMWGIEPESLPEGVRYWRL